MVAYCQVSKAKAGAPPDVVGIQNELPQPTKFWHEMTLALRAKLDKAGFHPVRIHMSDSGCLKHYGDKISGLERAVAFRGSRDVWAAIDYSATHIYDYQQYFTKPDEFDPHMVEWRKLTGDKMFLSTELCIADGRYQVPSYRMALCMGQLYHKNLVLMDAAAICYCWTLLNVEQPSYGWTRSLCVPDSEDGAVPVPSSQQLRVFGAYTRRIRQGMTRVDASADAPCLLASAFAGEDGQQTLVLLNRAMQPLQVCVEWPGARFTHLETASPYQPNLAVPAPAMGAGGKVDLTVAPGAIVTLTNVPLGEVPAGLD